MDISDSARIVVMNRVKVVNKSNLQSKTPSRVTQNRNNMFTSNAVEGRFQQTYKTVFYTSDKFVKYRVYGCLEEYF
jgi:hypothetical protein